MAGKKANNLTLANPSYSFEDLFSINAGSLTNATRDNFQVLVLNNNIALCFYSGTGALTLSQFNSLPVNSVIFAGAIAAPGIYIKISATAFKFSAAV